MEVRFGIDGSIDPVSGEISLGGRPRVIEPKEADFEMPTEEPPLTVDFNIVDNRTRMRRSLFEVMKAQEGLESLRMADFLKSLTNAERQSLYEDVFQRAPNFVWLLCVPPKHEEAVITDIKAVLAIPDKHSSDFRQKRKSLEAMLEKVIGDRFQHRNNARYVRANPQAIPRFQLPNGEEFVGDEAYYRSKLQQTAL